MYFIITIIIIIIIKKMSKSKFSILQISAQQQMGLEGGNEKSQRHPSTSLIHRYAPQPWALRNVWLYTCAFTRGCQYSNSLVMPYWSIPFGYLTGFVFLDKRV